MTISHPRPLSPHLQVYRVQLTSFLSVLHRGTGMALFFGIFGVTFWLIALASGPQELSCFYQVLDSWPGRFCGVGWIFSIYYHLCNGIRHLAWDWGLGFELKKVYITGWIVVFLSSGATLLTLWFLWGGLS